MAVVVLACASEDPTPEPPRGPLVCGTAVRDLVGRLEANYIAYAQIADSARVEAYEALREDVVAAADSTGQWRCTEVANRLTDFFDDGHLSVIERPEYTDVALDSIRRSVTSSRPSLDSLHLLERAARARQQVDMDGIEGVWTDGRSRFVVTRRGDGSAALVLETTVEGITPGEVKLTLRSTGDRYRSEYLSYGHAPRHVQVGVFREGALLQGGGVTWVREGAAADGAWHTVDPADPLAPSIVRIDDDHTLLTIPSFAVDGESFEALLKEHDDDLTDVRVLIVDIRGNRGGNTIYFPLIERFATRGLAGSQGLVLSSPDNIAYFRQGMGWFSRTYRPLVKRMEANPGAVVDGPAYPGRSFDPPRSRIESVAILADAGSMSAAESFILHARGARERVTTFGEPTEGVIDYTSVNAVPLDSGRRRMFLRYPTGTLHRAIPRDGYNRTGIVPDVPIPDSVADAVGAVLAHYRR